MDNKSIQRLLAAAGYYTGGIDGSLGPKSLAGINKLLTNRASECTSNPTRWSAKRKAVGAAQLVLKHAGFAPGAIDGYSGVNTEEALRAWDYYQSHKKLEAIDRTPSDTYIGPKTSFPSQAQCNSFYGVPGAKNTLASIRPHDLPLPMRLDWALSTRVKTAQFHVKCGSVFVDAIARCVQHYGEKRWRELGLDRFAGSYNLRKMRGGTSWSMHAYACAMDLFAAPNGLRVSSPQALFSGFDYVAWFNICEGLGLTSLGRAIDRDWMHVQAASLK